jgi:diguanylate cyclase (GGDEF)-like protein
MALGRSAARAQNGSSLVLGLVLPALIVAALIAGAVALLVNAAGHTAADKEIDARAATVKKAWDVAGRPASNPQLARLGTRLNAQLRVVRGSHPRPVTSIGKTRNYSFATRRGSTLRVGLPTQQSTDALSKGLVAALIVGLAGVLLLAALLSALLRSTVAPLRAMKAPLDDLRARNAELEAQIGRDALTGLLSGPHVRHALEVEMKRASREMAPLTLVLLDLDKLKVVNEAHGKQAGDRVLRGMVSRVGAGLRETDVFGRVAGGEFALILPNAGADHAEMAVARARDAVADLVLEGLTLTFSAGYACFPADGREAESLTQAAEGALKLAKREGAATRRFDPTEVSLRHQEGDRHEVVAVIEAPDGITPVFQPLVALSTGQISGYEALTRFKMPPKRFPDQWFNLAARVGMGPALEAAAIKRALAVPGRPVGTYLSLNLSPSTLRSPEVDAVLPRDLTGLVIEVTEHELAADDNTLADDLAILRERGARVAVDDAGAGYAGLQQLMRVTPDLIKLDRSLVQNIHEDPAKQALVESFVRFGRRTGAQVVAEGIETEEELRVLADLDVTYGQGYYLAKPGPPWVSVSPWVSEKLLRRSLGGQISVEDISKLPVGSDQRLAAVAARIARATTIADLAELKPVIADELGADELVLLTRTYDGALTAVAPRPWLPNQGRLELTHFPALEGALRSGDPDQILADRGSGTTTGMGEVALLANSGFGSMLIVPVGPHAIMQAFLTEQLPWSRAQTNRAVVLAYQLAPVLAALAAHAPAA